MFEVKASKKELDKNSKKTYSRFSKFWAKTLKRYKNKAVREAKVDHDYTDRTGLLTRRTQGIFDKDSNKQSISIFNTVKYAKFVEESTNDKWIENSLNSMKRDFERDIIKVPKELR